MGKEGITRFVSDNQTQMTRTLSDLVAIPTFNPPGQDYKRCVFYLSERLNTWNIEHDVISISSGKNPRAAILGEIGNGAESLHLHGHYDVVPSDSPSQLNPDVKGEHLHGRGASDMKSGLVVILYSLLYFKSRGAGDQGKISFSFVPDEESGGRLGTQYLFQSGLLPHPSLGMLMPEPTSGVVWNANKGALTYRVTIRGKAAHVALESQGKNAFESMVRLVQPLLDLKESIRKRKTSLPVSPPEASLSVLLTGGMSGSGLNYNVVPDRAFFTVDRRINPEEKLSEARQELMDIFDDARRKGIKLEVETLQEGESSSANVNSPLALALKDSIIKVTGKIPAFELCPGLCEIRFFNDQGIPAYAYGPGLLEVSHGPEEYVKLTDMWRCTEIYIRTILQLLS
jgi:acetylornithine deacetylase/succinyl-diaminopimelate desuccinylase family protein